MSYTYTYTQGQSVRVCCVLEADTRNDWSMQLPHSSHVKHMFIMQNNSQSHSSVVTYMNQCSKQLNRSTKTLPYDGSWFSIIYVHVHGTQKVPISTFIITDFLITNFQFAYYFPSDFHFCLPNLYYLLSNNRHFITLTTTEYHFL